MKLRDARSAYDAFSSKTSEIARQLSFAGIALIWLFRQVDAPVMGIPEPLLFPTLLFALALALDLLHAAYGALAWGAFSRYHEWKGITEENDVTAPPLINWPSIAFFWSKVVAVISAYIMTIQHIWSVANGP